MDLQTEITDKLTTDDLDATDFGREMVAETEYRQRDTCGYGIEPRREGICLDETASGFEAIRTTPVYVEFGAGATEPARSRQLVYGRPQPDYSRPQPAYSRPQPTSLPATAGPDQAGWGQQTEGWTVPSRLLRRSTGLLEPLFPERTPFHTSPLYVSQPVVENDDARANRTLFSDAGSSDEDVTTKKV